MWARFFISLILDNVFSAVKKHSSLNVIEKLNFYFLCCGRIGFPIFVLYGIYSVTYLGGGGQRPSEVRPRVPGVQGGGPGSHTPLLLHGQDQLGGIASSNTADQAASGLSHTCRWVLDLTYCTSYFPMERHLPLWGRCGAILSLVGQPRAATLLICISWCIFCPFTCSINSL